MKRLFLTFFCVAAAFVILTAPALVTDGVREGIRLNLYSVIPSLFPFMILTNVMLKYDLCNTISYFFYPLLSKIYKISRMGCFAMIIGFTCGFPMGAKIVGDLYSCHYISQTEARYLITFCNNCSITFLLNYIVFDCLGSSVPLHSALFFVYLPPLITGFINRFLMNPDIGDASVNNKQGLSGDFNPISRAVMSMSMLCVYIICFTILANAIAGISFLPETVKCAVLGITEITSGTNFIATTMSSGPLRTFLVLFSTVFGGLSIMFQSFAQLPDKVLKKYYLLGKLEQIAIFSILFMFRGDLC